MNKKYSIKSIKNGVEYDSILETSWINNDFVIKYTSEVLGIICESRGAHPFVVLQRLREILEKDNVLLLCKGNRLDVHPSGGLLTGIGALKLQIGRRVDITTDIVKIFDPEIETLMLATVDKQNDYYDEWLNSIRGLSYDD